MRMKISIYDGMTIGEAWCEISDAHKDCGADEISHIYGVPTLFAAMEACTKHPKESSLADNVFIRALTEAQLPD